MRFFPCTLLLTLVGTSCTVAQQPTTVFLVRHAEAASTPDDRDPPLTELGKLRSQELVHVLGESGITSVYSTPFIRTRDTAKPLADFLNIAVIETPVEGDFVADLAEVIRSEHQGETMLVVGHSNTTPDLVNALGAGPLDHLGHEEHDDVFIVVISDGSSTLARVRFGQETP